MSNAQPQSFKHLDWAAYYPAHAPATLALRMSLK